MAETIWKFPLTADEGNAFSAIMPRRARSLSAGWQDMAFVVWAAIDPGEAREERYFHIAGTDSAKKAQGACKRGHPYTSENTINKPNGTRWCRECRRARDRARTRPPGYWKAVNDRRRGRG
jgi:hypothetical protein